ncbi:MAG: response regulator [Spirulinaceae cyanobacterium]
MHKTILVVDDEEDVRSLIKLGLEMAAGWQVLTANSGQEALNVATTQQPDIILLDMMMPDLDGKETIQKLKANSPTKDIPVILMTAKIASSLEETLAGLDIAAIFTKPLRPLQLPKQILDALK